MDALQGASSLIEALRRRLAAAWAFFIVQYVRGLPRRTYDEARSAYERAEPTAFRWATYRPWLRAILTTKYDDPFVEEKRRVLLGAMDKASPVELARALDSVDYRGPRAPATADLALARYYFAGAVLDIFEPVFLMRV